MRGLACAVLAACLAEPDLGSSQFRCSAEHPACPDGFVCNTGRDRDTCQRPCDPASPSCAAGLACIDYGDPEPVYLCGTTSAAASSSAARP